MNRRVPRAGVRVVGGILGNGWAAALGAGFMVGDCTTEKALGSAKFVLIGEANHVARTPRPGASFSSRQAADKPLVRIRAPLSAVHRVLTKSKNCHSEERSDEESVVCPRQGKADSSLRSE